MNIGDYKFEVGDEVITIIGGRGKIIDICKCPECARRGFYEPIWLEDGAEHEDYITHLDAGTGFSAFYKIGKYRFSDFDRNIVLVAINSYEKQIYKWKKSLEFMDRVESGYVEKEE